VSIPLKEALKGRTFGLSRHIKNEAGAKKRFMRAFPCGDKLRAGAKRLTGFCGLPKKHLWDKLGLGFRDGHRYDGLSLK
jgi:hypothetical protein